MTDPFDRYEALGWNCEAAFQIKRIGRSHGGFFAWTICSPNVVAHVVENRFVGVLKPENFAFNALTGLVSDRRYGYDFHSPYATRQPADDPDFAAKFALHRAKAAYLIEKFDEPGRRCFLMVCRHNVTQAQVHRLRAALRLRHTDFQVVVLRARSWCDGAPDEPQISYRYLERLAPADAANQGHIPSWDAVFSEFPVAMDDGDLAQAG